MRKIATFSLVMLALSLTVTPAAAQGSVGSINDIGSYSVFGMDSVTLKKGVAIEGGNVGVQQAGSRLSIGQESTFLDPDSAAVGDEMRVAKRAVVQNAFFNELRNRGSILGAQSTPLDLPVVQDIPEEPALVPGTEPVKVRKGGSLVLPQGRYGKISVGKGATLIFEGGDYSAVSIKTERGASLLFAGSSEVVVQDKVRLGREAAVGPADGAGIGASDIVFFVVGYEMEQDADESSFAEDYEHVDESDLEFDADGRGTKVIINKDSDVSANFVVLDGKIRIDKNTRADGSCVAEKGKIGKNVVVSHDSAFRVGMLFNEFERTLLKLDRIGAVADESIVTDYLHHSIGALRDDTDSMVDDPEAKASLISVLDEALQGADAASDAVLAFDEDEANAQIGNVRSSIENYVTQIGNLGGSSITDESAAHLTEATTEISGNSLRRGGDAGFLTTGVPLVTASLIIDLADSTGAHLSDVALLLESEGFDMSADARTASPTKAFIVFTNGDGSQEVEFEAHSLALGVMAALEFLSDAEDKGAVTGEEVHAQFFAAMPELVPLLAAIDPPVTPETYFDITVCQYVNKKLDAVICIGGGLGLSVIDMIKGNSELHDKFEEIMKNGGPDLLKALFDQLFPSPNPKADILWYGVSASDTLDAVDHLRGMGLSVEKRDRPVSDIFDASLVVIAGQGRNQFSAEEKAELQNYANGGGNLIFAVDTDYFHCSPNNAGCAFEVTYELFGFGFDGDVGDGMLENATAPPHQIWTSPNMMVPFRCFCFDGYVNRILDKANVKVLVTIDGTSNEAGESPTNINRGPGIVVNTNPAFNGGKVMGTGYNMMVGNGDFSMLENIINFMLT